MLRSIKLTEVFELFEMCDSCLILAALHPALVGRRKEPPRGARANVDPIWESELQKSKENTRPC